MTAPPTHCPRCPSPLRNEHGDLTCLVHGTAWWANRAWDALEEPPPESKRHIAPNAGRPWTAEERATVIARRNELSSIALAADLSRTPHAIDQMLSKAGLRKVRTLNSSVVRKRANSLDQLEDTVRPGQLPRVARRRGMSYGAAYMRLRRRGVLLREADGMMSIAEVCDEYGCSRDRVERLIELGTLAHERIGHGPGSRVRIDPTDAEIVAPLLRARSKYDPRKRQ